MRCVLPILCLLLGAGGAVAAPRDRPMTFEVRECCGSSAVAWIEADGEITSETPDEFLRFLASKPPGSTINFHSLGGNLFAALRLGRLIRKHGYSTNVWAPDKGDGAPTEPGVCASACAYAFLGGKTRRIDAPSRYGVHQFFSKAQIENIDTKAFTGLDISDVQLVTGILAGYVAEMGADARLVEIAAKTSPGVMTYLTSHQVAALRISSNPSTMRPWRLDLRENGLVAFTAQGDEDAGIEFECERGVRRAIAWLRAEHCGRLQADFQRFQGAAYGQWSYNIAGNVVPHEKLALVCRKERVELRAELPAVGDIKLDGNTAYADGVAQVDRFFFNIDGLPKLAEPYIAMAMRNCRAKVGQTVAQPVVAPIKKALKAASSIAERK